MKAQKNHDNPWKSYNNEPLREGEVLVPQLVDDRNYAIAIGAKPENLRMVKGRRFLHGDVCPRPGGSGDDQPASV